MRIIGIDPGSVHAAFALVDDGELIEAADFAVVDRMLDARDFARAIDEHVPEIAVVELVSAMPKQGVSSSFRFGMGCGIIHGVLAAMNVPVHLTSAGRWKRAMGLDSDPEKSRALAIRTWPLMASVFKRKKDHNRAEAALMALYLERLRQ